MALDAAVDSLTLAHRLADHGVWGWDIVAKLGSRDVVETAQVAQHLI
jgi:hypothetical protein